MICHAGCKNGFVPNSLENISLKPMQIIYQINMNADLFETWFEKQLLPNVLQKCVFITDNVSYHSRIEKKIPTMATRKSEMIEFMLKHKIPIPEPVPTKPVLLPKRKLVQRSTQLTTLQRNMVTLFSDCPRITAF